MANIKKAVLSRFTANRDGGKSVTFDSSSCGPFDKRGLSVGPRKNKASKTTCDNVVCRHRDTQTGEESRLARCHEELALFLKEG